MTKLATPDVEDMTYFRAAQRVDVRTALGYQFSSSTTDYDRLVAELAASLHLVLEGVTKGSSTAQAKPQQGSRWGLPLLLAPGINLWL